MNTAELNITSEMQQVLDSNPREMPTKEKIKQLINVVKTSKYTFLSNKKRCQYIVIQTFGSWLNKHNKKRYNFYIKELNRCINSNTMIMIDNVGKTSFIPENWNQLWA